VFFSSLPCIGLDIGSWGVKLACVRRKTVVYHIEKFPRQNLPKKIVIDIIAKALSKMGVREKFVNTSIEGNEVIVRYANFPLMSKKNLLKTLNFEIEKYVPFKKEEISVDVEIIDRKFRKNQMLVVIVGAKRNLIEERVSIIKELGLEPFVVTTDCMALVSAFKKSSCFKPTVTIGLLDIGYKLSKLVIVKGGIPYFSRIINLGDFHFLSALIERYNLEIEEAEKFKCNLSDREKEVLSIFQRNFRNLPEEVQLSFDYCEHILGGVPTCLYISGGGAKTIFLKDFLKNYLNVEVHLWDVLESFHLNPSSEEKLFFNVAVGLSLTNRVF